MASLETCCVVVGIGRRLRERFVGFRASEGSGADVWRRRAK